jgi:hypothetical protein
MQQKERPGRGAAVPGRQIRAWFQYRAAAKNLTKEKGLGDTSKALYACCEFAD